MTHSIDIILPSLSVGGAEKMMLLLAEQYRLAGWSVRFIIRRSEDSIYHRNVARNYDLIDLGAPRVRDFPGKLWRFYRSHPHPDLVLVSLWPLTMLSSWVIRRLGLECTLICIEHGSLKYRVAGKSRWYRAFLRHSLRWTISWSDYVVGVSEGLRDEIRAVTGYGGEKLVFIPNPIELSAPEPGSQEARSVEELLPLLSGPVLLSVGRLKKVKNIPLLLEAFARAASARELSLVIVGDGAEKEKLQSLADSLGVRDRVHFVGFVENCAPYYELADLFVLSSDSEGFGNVIVEALMRGCTVVSTDCDYGPREILQHGKYGYLTPVGNAPALTEAILQALSSPVPREKAIQRGQEFTPFEVFKQYNDLLHFD